jgi:hypothetical protein
MHYEREHSYLGSRISSGSKRNSAFSQVATASLQSEILKCPKFPYGRVAPDLWLMDFRDSLSSNIMPALWVQSPRTHQLLDNASWTLEAFLEISSRGPTKLTAILSVVGADSVSELEAVKILVNFALQSSSFFISALILWRLHVNFARFCSRRAFRGCAVWATGACSCMMAPNPFCASY